MKKRFGLLVSALLWQAGALAGTPEFYLVDISSDKPAVLYTTARKVDRAEKRAFVVLGSGRQTCCFVSGPNARPKSDELLPTLVSPEGDETYRFPGAYRAMGTPGKIDDLAFGIGGMTGAKKVGKDAYELNFAQGPAVIVRHCNGMEGINLELYRSLRDRKPFATYYYALGYDIEPDCPGR